MPRPVLWLLFGLTVLRAMPAVFADDAIKSQGQAVIRAPAGQSEIVITTTPRVAGAIHSLTWNGKEFIDSFDHGRQVQSAANFDAGSPFTSETFNPTEAGSRSDGVGESSSSRLLHMTVAESALQTTTQMAFWLAPGERSSRHLAKNQGILSNHLLTKRVLIGYRDLPNVIQYNVTFSLPIGERHDFAQFEAVTGYMPAEFQRFWKYNPKLKITRTALGRSGRAGVSRCACDRERFPCDGWFSPDQPSKGTNKRVMVAFALLRRRWSNGIACFASTVPRVFRRANTPSRTFVIVGDLPTVTQSLRVLHGKFE